MLLPTRPALPAVFSGPRSVNASHLLDGGGSKTGPERIYSTEVEFQQIKEIEKLLN
jgi:hypothetical protein